LRMRAGVIAKVIFNSAVVGLVTVLAAVLVALLIGAPILASFLTKRTSNSGGEVGLDLRALFNYFLGPTWTTVLFLVLFSCGFIFALRHFLRSLR
jgi:hypothetical protein